MKIIHQRKNITLPFEEIIDRLHNIVCDRTNSTQSNYLVKGPIIIVASEDMLHGDMSMTYFLLKKGALC